MESPPTTFYRSFVARGARVSSNAQGKSIARSNGGARKLAGEQTDRSVKATARNLYYATATWRHVSHRSTARSLSTRWAAFVSSWCG